MARIRTIKPEFFRHAALYDAEKASGLPLRLAFAGLWTAADREGRFRWQPRVLKLDCLPYDECDFGEVLEALARSGFIMKYEINGESFGCIPGWKNHQFVNNRETPSKLPAPIEGKAEEPRVVDASGTRESNDIAGREGERKGKGRETDAAPNGAQIVSLTPSPEKMFFDQAVQFLGPDARSLAAKLLKAKSGNVPAAHSALLTAIQKSNPREYLGAIIRGRDSIDDLRARGDAW